jgi:hypothetical protein
MSENTVGPKTKKVTSWSRKASPLKIILVLIFLCIILISSAAFAVYFKSKNNQKNEKITKITNQCSSEQQKPLLNDVYEALKTPDITKLKPYVDKIQLIPGYQNDSNCLYPIVIYQINRGDPAAAKNALELLKKAYDKNIGYDPLYGPSTKSPEQFDAVVTYMLEEQARTAKQFEYLSKEQKQ